MNILVLLTSAILLLSYQCFCYKLRMTAVLPGGFRACIASEKGLESFSFYAYILNGSPKESSKRLEGTVTKPSDGLWCYKEKYIVLRFRDEIVYWYRVVQNGQTLSGTGTKILQAADFLDESGDSVPTSTIPSYVKPTTEATGFLRRIKNWFRPRNENQQEEVDINNKKEGSPPILPVTSGQGLQHNGDPRLTNIGIPTSTKKSLTSGVLKLSQPETDHDASSTVNLETQLDLKVESKENNQTEETKLKSSHAQTVDEYIRSPGSKLNENKQIGGNKDNITSEITENPQNYSSSARVTERSVLNYHNSKGKAFLHDDQIVHQQPAAIVDLTTAEQQVASEILKKTPMAPNIDNFNKTGHALGAQVEPQKHSEADRHHEVIEPYYAVSDRMDQKERNEETELQFNVSPPGTHVSLEPRDENILKKGIDEYDNTAKGDSINIKVVINSQARPCDTSALFDLPRVDTKSKVPSPEEDISSSHKNKTKSCETLLSHEKKLGEAARNSYQECALKVDVIENDVIDSKKEARLLSSLLKVTLEMINYLKENSTNKLVLKSSIPLIDYKQVLREVIHSLLDVKPIQYNIVQCELKSNNIVTFELGDYNEKILLLLNGRIKLPGSNFQLIDYDA